ncbi:MAG: sulfurtransferase TusA family protein [Metallosphaera sp.]
MELNLVGLCCSTPQLTVYKALKRVRPGSEIRIITDDRIVLERDLIPLIESFKATYTIREENGNFIIDCTK